MNQLLAALALAAATPAAADVTSSAPDSFVLDSSITIAAPQAKVWETLRNPQGWWNPEHSYSGKAANLYLDAQATGCFCERLDGKGSIEHAHVVYVQPGRMMRLTGGLGPLQAEAVSATLTFRLDPDGTGTKVTMQYVVGGFMRRGGEALAPVVDRVLADQLGRLKAAAEAASPAP